ncbi:MAG: DUF3524 domain-containing protein [Gemmatimonadetes bacterium]|nr:DUF3524 domain-containing protein [Gemmatimonadota bacterium]
MSSILFIEPFFGGSHRAFAEGYARHSRHHVRMLTLPGRNWKWRMRGGAAAIAAKAASAMASDGTDSTIEAPDALLVTSLINLAELRGLGPVAWREAPAILYFHENQLTYPIRGDNKRDLHFAMTHAISILAADSIAFNSEYHKREFLEALPGFLQALPDTKPRDILARVEDALVLHPGIDSCDDRSPHDADVRGDANENARTVLWNHRWEYDKGPDRLLRVIRALRARKVRFRLIVTGAGHDERADVFSELPDAAGPHLAHIGYVAGREEYARLLRAGDIVVSTARHEFFGISCLEAVLAGAFPLLPRALSYPELIDPARFPSCYYQDTDDLVERLAQLLMTGERPPGGLRDAVRHHVWPAPARLMDDAVEALHAKKERT